MLGLIRKRRVAMLSPTRSHGQDLCNCQRTFERSFQTLVDGVVANTGFSETEARITVSNALVKVKNRDSDSSLPPKISRHLRLEQALELKRKRSEVVSTQHKAKDSCKILPEKPASPSSSFKQGSIRLWPETLQYLP